MPPNSVGRTDSGTLRMDLGLFALSTAVLDLEVLQTRIFAFTLDALTLHVAVGICLLGLGASGTVLAVLPQVAAERVRAWAAGNALLGAVTIIGSHAVFAALSPQFLAGGAVALATTVALAVPYFFLGLATAQLLVARGGAVGRAYAFNLVGSGLGCLIVFPVLDLVGAELSLAIVAAIAVVAAAILAAPGGVALRAAFAVTALVVVAAGVQAQNLFEFAPGRTSQLSAVVKAVAQARENNPKLRISTEPLFSQWDRTGRVDIYSLETPAARQPDGGVIEPLDGLVWMQDGGAGSNVLSGSNPPDRLEEFYDRSVYGAGYALRDAKDVLIIGLGGGPDIMTALYHGATRVDAVDINGTAIEAIRTHFADYLGNPAQAPGVELHRMDGRAFVRASPDSFDLIQMSGVDTKTLFAAGALSLSENYLYTQEAMGEYLAHLRPEGRLAILRPTGFEVDRLVSVAVAALREIGAQSPERHVFVVEQGIWDSILIKRTPFTAAEVDSLNAWAEERGRTAPKLIIPFLEIIGISLAKPIEILYSPMPRPSAATPFMQAVLDGRMDEFVNAAEMDLSPPTDDRPFFFFRKRPENALRDPGPVLGRMYDTLGQQTIVAIVFILLPLVLLRARGLTAPRAGRTMLFFTCLGAAFMLVEIGLIQIFVLTLGHQSYSVTVVLFGLLAGASLGSALSSRIPISRLGPLAGAMAAMIAVIASYAVGLDLAFDAVATSSFGVRLGLSLLLLVILGIGLGIPFPTALRSLQVSSPLLVAWGIGVNGFASVLGASAALPIAMVFGLDAVLMLGVVLYAAAILAAPVGRASAT